jgi:hypothetical protein
MEEDAKNQNQMKINQQSAYVRQFGLRVWEDWLRQRIKEGKIKRSKTPNRWKGL